MAYYAIFGPSERGCKVARLALPATVRPRVVWVYVVGIGGVHLLALLALIPWLFSWTGVVLAIAGCYVFGTLGINLCYHRLLTHRGFSCPKWLEHGLSILGVCCLQDTPARWVAVHRLHHQHSDMQPDPHSPLVGFIWGHFGWLMAENTELSRTSMYERYARDVLRDRFYLGYERNLWWVWTVLLSWIAFFAGGFAAGWALTGDTMAGVQLGASCLVWGCFVRTVLVWHITWSVNSVTHLWGYRNYETDEGSRNNLLIGLVSNGEGWHNNHHAQPRSAAHGHRWWELDVTHITIRAFQCVGLAWDVIGPRRPGAKAAMPGREVQPVETD